MYDVQYLSVLLQRLHWASSKRPQWIVGQNDEYIYSVVLFCGPHNGKSAVCAPTWNLEQKVQRPEICCGKSM